MSWDHIMAGREGWGFDVSARRIALACEAMWQASMLAKEIASKLEGTDDLVPYALSIRVSQLADIASAALASQETAEADIFHRLFDRSMPEPEPAQEVAHG